jgi:hypothetical protein
MERDEGLPGTSGTRNAHVVLKNVACGDPCYLVKLLTLMWGQCFKSEGAALELLRKL